MKNKYILITHHKIRVSSKKHWRPWVIYVQRKHMENMWTPPGIIYFFIIHICSDFICSKIIDNYIKLTIKYLWQDFTG
jgi:hypothetical protein